MGFLPRVISPSSQAYPNAVLALGCPALEDEWRWGVWGRVGGWGYGEGKYGGIGGREVWWGGVESEGGVGMGEGGGRGIPVGTKG